MSRLMSRDCSNQIRSVFLLPAKYIKTVDIIPLLRFLVSNVKISGKIYVKLTIFLFPAFLSAENSWNSFMSEMDQMSSYHYVKIDNDYIQRYNGLVGKWVIRPSKLSSLAKKYDTTSAEIKKVNKFTTSFDYYRKRYIFVPYSKEYLKKLKQLGISQRREKVRRGEFVWPLDGSYITSRVGTRWGGRPHSGLDIAAAIGTIVVSAIDGEVISAGRHGGFGYSVLIKHKDGYTTRYAHLARTMMTAGTIVKKGQIIGYSGNTGRSTGPHLHFEVRYFGIVLDPESFLTPFKSSQSAAFEFNAFLKSKERVVNKL